MSTTIRVPPNPWLSQFQNHQKESPSRISVKDYETGKEATPTELLYEVLSQRDRIWASLDDNLKKRLHDPDDDVYMAIIARSGFEFAVLLFAIHAVGGVVVPLRRDIHVKEASYFLGTCQASLITSSQLTASHAESISSALGIQHYSFEPTFPSSADPTTIHFEQVPNPETPSINEPPIYHPNRSFALLYTSGTTGPPKGALSSCDSTLRGAVYYTNHLDLSSKDNWIHQHPVHWKGGVDFVLVGAYSGGGMEFANGVFGPGWFWERMWRGSVQGLEREGGGGGGGEGVSEAGKTPITCFIAPPAVLTPLRETLDQIRESDWEEYQQAVDGLQHLRLMLTGAMRVPDSLKNTWRELRAGREVVNLYGFTEASGMISITDWRARGDVGTDNCGPHAPDAIVKANEDGEICVKGPRLMKRYLSTDPTVNNNIFDAEGFYKTGDLGTVTEKGEIVIYGRASQDVIRTSSYQVNAADIEDPLATYPGVSDTFVLATEDTRVGQRVTALILQKINPATGSPTPESAALPNKSLAEIRWYLAVEKGVYAFKLPTLLRVIRQDEFRATTDNGKPSKKKIASMYFSDEDVERGDVQAWDLSVKEQFPGDRPWDWDGRTR